MNKVVKVFYRDEDDKEACIAIAKLLGLYQSERSLRTQGRTEDNVSLSKIDRDNPFVLGEAIDAVRPRQAVYYEGSLSEPANLGGAIVVPSLSVLGHSPEAVIKAVTTVIRLPGVKVLCPEVGGEVDVSALVRYARPFEEQARLANDRIAALEDQLIAQETRHADELEQAMQDALDHVLDLLKAKGISLVDFLATPSVGNATLNTGGNTARGRALRMKREALGLTQQNIADLFTPPVNKSVISKAENHGKGPLAEIDAKLDAYKNQTEEKELENA